MKILRGSRGLADLHVVLGGELHKAFQAGAGMFRPLAFVAMRQKHHNTRGEIPLGLARADELVDDHLSAVCEIAELRLPKGERFGEVAAETAFETETADFRPGGDG